MSRFHGNKALSECHGARLRFEQNGEWPEWYCTAKDCGVAVHPDGRSFRYTPRDLLKNEPTAAHMESGT